MWAYVDTSVIMRHVLNEDPRIDLRVVEKGFTNELLRVEALRTIDRIRLERNWPGEVIAQRIQALIVLLGPMQEITLQPPILRRASETFTVAIGTLDALHLATAILIRDQIEQPLLFLTHDRRQGIAAQAAGFEVRGCFG